MSTKSKVVSITSKSGAEAKNFERKWGKVVEKAKFTVLPALLLRAQGRLGITPVQLAILVQIIDYWWSPERWPWASYGELSDRLNIGEKVIQRNLKALEDRGYVKRITRIQNHRRRANGYDLQGLIDKLNKLAPEFIAAQEAARKAEKKGASLGVLARKSKAA